MVNQIYVYNYTIVKNQDWKIPRVSCYFNAISILFVINFGISFKLLLRKKWSSSRRNYSCRTNASTLRETDPVGVGSWVRRRSNLGRDARANPNPAYPESNFGSFEGGPPRGRTPRKKSSTVVEKRRERKGARNPRLPSNTQEEESQRTETRNFSSRDSDYQRADRLFLPILLEKISKEKREKWEKKREKESGRFPSAIKSR